MTGKTFRAEGQELGFAIDHIQDRLAHEGPVRVRITGLSTVSGARVDLMGEIVSAVRRVHPQDRFLQAFMFQTSNRVFTVGGRDACREDIAAETITLY
ncbi:MAG TPA: TrmB family transcriptional regulator sugar-binding domain-containing protein [Candidatus Thermoplasmatota archaeon]|nr:TrmB family transcriptional regulator sugar-binding domain-containing protein [Candidatus Thermoplasmatota archaeon]